MSDTATVAPATAAVGTTDPMDDFEMDDVISPESFSIPEHMMLGNADKKPAEDEPAAEAEAVTEAPKAEAEPTLPEGYTKDARGRVHRPDGTLASKDEVAAFAQKPAETTEPAKPEKFRYRYNGENHEMEGFDYDPTTGAVTVKPEHVGLLRDAMNARHVLADGRDINEGLRAQVAELQGQLTERQQVETVEQAQVRTLLDHYGKALEEPDDIAAGEAFFMLRAQYPVLMANAKARHYQQQLESARQAPKQAPQKEPENTPASVLPAREIAVKHTQEYVQQLKLDHAYRDLKAEDWKQLDARYERTPYAFLRPATAEEAQQYGYAEGEIVFDTDAFSADVTEYVSTLRSGRETAESRAKLAADNARRTQPSVTTPPTPGGGRAPAKASKPITSKEELDDWWENSEL